MKDATINIDGNAKEQSNPFNQIADGQCPFILTTDDLMLELTKLYVNNVNKERLLNSCASKLKATEEFVLKAKDIKEENEKLKLIIDTQNKAEIDKIALEKELVLNNSELIKVKDSNRMFDTNNKNLDRALTGAREEGKRLKVQNKDLDVSLVTAQEKVQKLEIENKTQDTKNTKLTEKIQALKKPKTRKLKKK